MEETSPIFWAKVPSATAALRRAIRPHARNRSVRAVCKGEKRLGGVG